MADWQCADLKSLLILVRFQSEARDFLLMKSEMNRDMNQQTWERTLRCTDSEVLGEVKGVRLLLYGCHPSRTTVRVSQGQVMLRSPHVHAKAKDNMSTGNHWLATFQMQANRLRAADRFTQLVTVSQLFPASERTLRSSVSVSCTCSSTDRVTRFERVC